MNSGWLKISRNADFKIEDQEGFDSHSVLFMDLLKALFEVEPCTTVREFAKELSASMKEADKWISH